MCSWCILTRPIWPRSSPIDQHLRQQRAAVHVSAHRGGRRGYEEETLAETQHFAFWHSATPVTQYLSGEDLEAFQKAAEQTDAQMQANGAWKDYAQQMPLVRITWRMTRSSRAR